MTDRGAGPKAPSVTTFRGEIQEGKQSVSTVCLKGLVLAAFTAIIFIQLLRSSHQYTVKKATDNILKRRYPFLTNFIHSLLFVLPP